MAGNLRKKKLKDEWRHIRINLIGKRRADGSLFVTSPNFPPFSAVLVDGKWRSVVGVLETFLKANFGRVKDIMLIEDASELIPDTDEMPEMPPAYVVAELTQSRAGSRTSRS